MKIEFETQNVLQPFKFVGLPIFGNNVYYVILFIKYSL